MSSVFSSPSKQAQSVSGAASANTSNEAQIAEQYISNADAATREAIAGLGANPYYGAAANMNPGAYAVNPSNTVTFGQSSLPAGLQGGQPQSQSNEGVTGAKSSGGNPMTPTPGSSAGPAPAAPTPPVNPMPVNPTPGTGAAGGGAGRSNKSGVY